MELKGKNGSISRGQNMSSFASMDCMLKSSTSLCRYLSSNGNMDLTLVLLLSYIPMVPVNLGPFVFRTWLEIKYLNILSPYMDVIE